MNMSMIPPIIPFIGTPEPKYRILEIGEVIQEGDERDCGSNRGWVRVKGLIGWRAGIKQTPDGEKDELDLEGTIFRRPVK